MMIHHVKQPTQTLSALDFYEMHNINLIELINIESMSSNYDLSQQSDFPAASSIMPTKSSLSKLWQGKMQ